MGIGKFTDKSGQIIYYDKTTGERVQFNPKTGERVEQFNPVTDKTLNTITGAAENVIPFTRTVASMSAATNPTSKVAQFLDPYQGMSNEQKIASGVADFLSSGAQMAMPVKGIGANFIKWTAPAVIGAGASKLAEIKPVRDIMSDPKFQMGSALLTSGLSVLPFIKNIGQSVTGVNNINKFKAFNNTLENGANMTAGDAKANWLDDITSQRQEAADNINKSITPLEKLTATNKIANNSDFPLQSNKTTNEFWDIKSLGQQAYDTVQKYLKQNKRVLNDAEYRKLDSFSDRFKDVKTMGDLNTEKTTFGRSIKTAFDPNDTSLAGTVKRDFYDKIRQVFVDNIPDTPEAIQYKKSLLNAWDNYSNIKNAMSTLGIRKIGGEYTMPNIDTLAGNINKIKVAMNISPENTQAAVSQWLLHDTSAGTADANKIIDKIGVLNNKNSGAIIFGNKWEGIKKWAKDVKTMEDLAKSDKGSVDNFWKGLVGKQAKIQLEYLTKGQAPTTLLKDFASPITAGIPQVINAETNRARKVKQ